MRAAGAARRRLGRHEEALGQLRAALAIELAAPDGAAGPGAAETYCERGKALQAQGRSGEALAMFRRDTRIPRAAMVAGMADDLADRGLDGEPAIPIYVHPAVSIAPRY
jgi:tetratricopeptide (TPR) repeat protein